ncbi:C-type lectin domain family 4 member G-like isoform X2 [Poeciliopsis prolifica]|nr:C-type lectin domain family 4 member G-like isoform X2 [Poeciliopsis prolifica]
MQNETPQESSDSKGLLSEKEAERRRRYYLKLACCLGTFCTILLLGIIGVTVYLVWYQQNELNELKESEAKIKDLTDQINNLTEVKNVSDSKIHNLTTENQELKKKTQELKEKNQNLMNQTQKLEGETRTLKEQLDNIMKTQNELNVSRAQWSIDQYCRKEKGWKCEPCQNGWIFSSSSCYAYNNEPRATQRTWEGAQQDCKGKVSHLVVVNRQEEKNYVKTISPAGKEKEINGYWIGLKAEGTKWKWTDGTELADQSWVNQSAVDGQCVTCLQDKEWQSVNCEDKNAWICEKKALSV